MNTSLIRRDGHPGVTVTLLIACGVLGVLAWALLRSSTETVRSRAVSMPVPPAVATLQPPPPREAAPRQALPAPAPIVPVASSRAVAPPNSTAREEARPDLLSEEDQQIRTEERRTLHERWERQTPNPAAEDTLYQTVAARLIARRLDASALSDLDCKRALCRFELSTRGEAGLTPVAEVHELIRAARDLGETWVLPTEPTPGRWRVEVFAPTQGHTLTGPAIE